MATIKYIKSRDGFRIEIDSLGMDLITDALRAAQPRSALGLIARDQLLSQIAAAQADQDLWGN